MPVRPAKISPTHAIHFTGLAIDMGFQAGQNRRAFAAISSASARIALYPPPSGS